MFKMLVAVDGSENSFDAVRHAVTLAQQMRAARIFLVNVQRPPMAGEVSHLVTGEEVAAMHEERGEAVLARAGQIVEQAGIPCESEVALGRPAETIIERAQHHGCDGIVIGMSRHGRVGALVLGSVADKVVHSSPLPVTLVR